MARQIEEIILKVSVDDRSAKGKLDDFTDSVDEANDKTKGFSTSLKTLGAVVAALGLKQLATEALKVSVEFDKIANSLQSVLGSQEAVNQEMAFLNELTDELGLNLLSTADAYSKVAAAARGTAIEGEGVRDIIQGVSEASTALGLSAEDTSGALRAINQIISKGTVQAEELRGQLGERIPGAFQIAARSIGVTTQELSKMLEQGEVLSEDFIPKFAAQLSNEFAGAAQDASGSAQANINRLSNEWQHALNNMGKAVAKFTPILTSLISSFNSVSEAVTETADGINIWLDELFGSEREVEAITDAQRRLWKEQKQAAKAAREEAKALREQKEAAIQLAAATERVASFTDISLGFFNEERLKNLTEQLNLTEAEYEKLAPAIMKAMDAGASNNEIIEETQFLLNNFKKELNDVQEVAQKRIENPFDKILKGQTFENRAKAFAKALGLTAKQFDKVGNAIAQAIEKGIDPETIKARLKGLADIGFFDKEERDLSAFNLDRQTSPVGSTFEAGSAAASSFLQSTRLNEERNQLLKDIAESSRKRAENPPVDLISKSGQG
jgi:tape measure domain-containing protein